MKNRMGIWIASVIMLPIVAFISFLSVKAAQGRENTIIFTLGGRAMLRNTIEIPLSEIDALQAIYSNKNLKVYPIEGDKVVIKEYLISDREDAKADVEMLQDAVTGRRTAAITGGHVTIITILGLFTKEEKIEIYIPREGLDALSLKTTSGNISAESDFALRAEELEIRADSGNIRWHDSEAEKLHIQVGSGNIGLEYMSGNLEVQTSSGNIKAGKVSGSMMVKAGSGNITVEQLCGQGSMEAHSGNIKVDAVEVTGDMTLKTGSGNIRLTLPKELSFRFQAQTGSGNISTDFDEVLSYNKKGNQAGGTIGGNSSCLIQAESSSGNVHISYSGK